VLTPQTQTQQTAAAYGEAVAHLHDLMDTFSWTDEHPQLDRRTLLDDPLLCIEHSRGGSEAAAFIRPIAERIADWLHGEHHDLATGVCHGDLQGGNAVLANDGTICFFDFERCGFGWRAYDLATFRWGAAMSKFRLGGSDATIDSLWAAYLDGYTRHRRLSAADLTATDVMVALRHIWYVGLEAKHADRWDRPVVDDAFWSREVDFLGDWTRRSRFNR
jgi:Ser/Thr protein kinase RdoA (MazF antagonist)